MSGPDDLNNLAISLKKLHVSGQPLLLANAYDGATATLVASLPTTKAVATASYAIAEVQGLSDPELHLEANIQGISYVVRGIKRAGKQYELPLSADLQDGYNDPAETVRQAIQLGVVGCNIEDLHGEHDPPTLRSLTDATERIKKAVQAAKDSGVPDFVINARCDAFGYGGSVADIIERGKAYLAAGATTVFVWGAGKVTMTEEHIKELVDAFDGRLAVQPGIHSIETLSGLGVSRISVGPMLWRTAQAVMKEQAAQIVEGRFVPPK